MIPNHFMSETTSFILAQTHKNMVDDKSVERKINRREMINGKEGKWFKSIQVNTLSHSIHWLLLMLTQRRKRFGYYNIYYDYFFLSPIESSYVIIMYWVHIATNRTLCMCECEYYVRTAWGRKQYSPNMSLVCAENMTIKRKNGKICWLSTPIDD